jgi:hypothetical protein
MPESNQNRFAHSLGSQSKIGNRKSKMSSDDFVRSRQHVGWNCDADLLAVLRFITSSSFVGCRAKSAGWALLKITEAYLIT